LQSCGTERLVLTFTFEGLGVFIALWTMIVLIFTLRVETVLEWGLVTFVEESWLFGLKAAFTQRFLILFAQVLEGFLGLWLRGRFLLLGLWFRFCWLLIDL